MFHVVRAVVGEVRAAQEVVHDLRIGLDGRRAAYFAGEGPANGGWVRRAVVPVAAEAEAGLWEEGKAAAAATSAPDDGCAYEEGDEGWCCEVSARFMNTEPPCLRVGEYLERQ